MEQRISSWQKFWGNRNPGPHEGKELLKLQTLAQQAEDPDPITEEMVAEAIKHSKNIAAPGYDQWIPADFKKLPQEGIQALAELLTKVEKARSWPAACLVNQVGSQPGGGCTSEPGRRGELLPRASSQKDTRNRC